MIYWRLITVTSPLSTAQRPSTLYITTSNFASSASRSVWNIQLYIGSHLIYEVDCSAFDMVAVMQPEYLSTTVSHRIGHCTIPLFNNYTAELCSLKFIRCCPSRRRRHIPDDDFHVNADQVKPVPATRNLGCLCGRWDVNEIPHVPCCRIVFQCYAPDPFYTNIEHLGLYLNIAAREMLVTSLVHSRLDYCNAVFAGL